MNHLTNMLARDAMTPEQRRTIEAALTNVAASADLRPVVAALCGLPAAQTAAWRGGACRPLNKWDDTALETVAVHPGEPPRCPDPTCRRTLPPGDAWAPEPGSTGAIVMRPRCPRCGMRVIVRFLAQ